MTSAPAAAPAQDRREALVQELTALFLAEGFRSFGVGDLAARLRCSRTTLYAVAPSKEQLVLTVLRRFFRDAAHRIEARVAAEADPGRRLAVYLSSVAEELEPAGDAFYADLAAHPPGAEIYAENTAAAARRVGELVTAGVEAGAMRPVDARFVGAAVATVMSAIQTGGVQRATGLADAAAYAALADLVEHGLARRP